MDWFRHFGLGIGVNICYANGVKINNLAKCSMIFIITYKNAPLVEHYCFVIDYTANYGGFGFGFVTQLDN